MKRIIITAFLFCGLFSFISEPIFAFRTRGGVQVGKKQKHTLPIKYREKNTPPSYYTKEQKIIAAFVEKKAYKILGKLCEITNTNKEVIMKK